MKTQAVLWTALLGSMALAWRWIDTRNTFYSERVFTNTPARGAVTSVTVT